MEVVRIGECSENMEFKYEVTFQYYAKSVELIDGDIVPMVLLTRYFKNNEGEWERCEINGYKYVTIDALMTNYVAIDSPVYKRIIDSNDLIKQFRYEKLNDVLKPYTDIYGNPEKPQACENIDPQGSAENSADVLRSNDVRDECYVKVSTQNYKQG